VDPDDSDRLVGIVALSDLLSYFLDGVQEPSQLPDSECADAAAAADAVGSANQNVERTS
jgi:hypothetical protein